MTTLIDSAVLLVVATISAVAVRLVFHSLDSSVGGTARVEIANYILGTQPTLQILNHARGLTDILLGQKLISKRSIFVSSAISITFFAALSIVYRDAWIAKEYARLPEFLLLTAVMAVVINVFPDNIIFMKSHRILQVTSSELRYRQKLELLGCDLISGVLMKWMSSATILFVVALLRTDLPEFDAAEWILKLASNVFSGDRITFAFIVVTTTAVSLELWLGLLALSLVVTRFSLHSTVIRNTVHGPLNVELLHLHPLKLVGNVASVLTLITFLLVGVVVELSTFG